MSSTPHNTFAVADVARALAARNLRSRFRITGTSMEPTLSAGAIVEVTAGAVPAIGDVLVFTQKSGRVVAHRIVGHGAEAYLTAGDAQPLTVEYVPLGDVIGTVRKIWPNGVARNAEPAILRHAQAILFGRCHRLRQFSARVRAWVALCIAPLPLEEPVFAALLDALQAYEERNEPAFTAALATVSAPVFLTCIKKHHCSSFFAHAFSLFPNAAEAHATLRAAIFRIHLASSRQITRVRAELALLLAALAPHAVAPILLKGAARISRGAATFECGYSGDIDLLFSPTDAQQVKAILCAQGYTFLGGAEQAVLFDRRHHHAAPMVRTAGAVPIEIHTALSEPHSTTVALTAATLQPFIVPTSAAEPTVSVLNTVGSAVHLAYHARGFGPVRDVLLLGRLLRAMSAAERLTFSSILQHEQRDATRLHAVYVRAARFAGLSVQQTNAAARYTAWVHVRERLNPRVAERVQVLESWYGRAPLARVHVASGVQRTLRKFGQWLIALQLGPVIRRHVARLEPVIHQPHSAKFS